LQLFAKVLFNSAIKLWSVSVGRFSILLNNLVYVTSPMQYLFIFLLLHGNRLRLLQQLNASVINNVLEQGELLLVAFPPQTK